MALLICSAEFSDKIVMWLEDYFSQTSFLRSSNIAHKCEYGFCWKYPPAEIWSFFLSRQIKLHCNCKHRIWSITFIGIGQKGPKCEITDPFRIYYKIFAVHLLIGKAGLFFVHLRQNSIAKKFQNSLILPKLSEKWSKLSPKKPKLNFCML